MAPPNEPQWEDYTAAVTRFLASIDTVLARGEQAQARMAEFYQRHGIEPGAGERALTSPSLPAAEREANRRLLAMREALAAAAQRAAPATPAPSTLPPATPPPAAAPHRSPSVAARALGNRTRI
jgi:hypothetical protein